MPWSPVPKFPEIVKDIIYKGYHNKPFPFNVLEVSIIKITGVTREKTIKNIAQTMEKLGYIERRGDLFLVRYDPFENKFIVKEESEIEKESEIEADTLLNKLKGKVSEVL